MQAIENGGEYADRPPSDLVPNHSLTSRPQTESGDNFASALLSWQTYRMYLLIFPFTNPSAFRSWRTLHSQ